MNSAYLQDHWLEFGLLFLWSLFWKGWALWRSARQEDKAWFIALLILNTVGLLEIFYLFIFSKRQHKVSTEAEQ